jgi:hypothetical protein
MRKMTFLSVLTAVAAIFVPFANAKTTVKILGAGSSAIWQTAAIGAFNELAGGSAEGAQHYTVKGTCTSGNCAQIHDVRSSSILLEGGNLWVVWNSAQTQVWAYISVDSVVGNRSFFAAPRAQLQIDPETETLAGQGLISASLWGADAGGLPTKVYDALNNAPLTTAFTDIRPEDAKMAECRVASTLGAALPTGYYGGKGLGYGTSCTTLQPASIQSEVVAGTTANPVDFNLSGTDPFTGQNIPSYTTIGVGASPIVFVINRTNSNGLGQAGFFTNMAQANLQALFSGAECDSNAFLDHGPLNVPVEVVLREPLSGTMNTTEYTTFYTNTSKMSQETNVNPASDNPLNKPCVLGGGKRVRAIGTGQEISNGVKPNNDSIGYAFFSYGNVAPLSANPGGNPDYGYLQVNGVDPISSTGSYTNGNLPWCNAPCPAAAGTSFPNLRNGTYPAWSLLRVVTDASGKNAFNTKALVDAIQENINSTVPDFVPFVAVSGDPGLQIYRSHFKQATIAPNNGLGGGTEKGGDVGGCIEPVGPPPGTTNCHQ